MKSETYKNKAKEIKEQREKLKNCPRNAKRIEALKTEEKRLKAKAKEKKAEEGNKSNIKSASTSTKKPSTSPSKEAKLEAGLHQLLANESSKGIKVDVSVEYDDEGNPHIDPNELSKAISKAVQDAPYEFDPVVAKKIKMRQRIKEIDNISTKNKDLSKSELSALKKEKATLEKDVEK